jgi:hypothetical protein
MAMLLLQHVHVVSLILVNAFHDRGKKFCGVAKLCFHSRAIASGLCEHGQAPRPFEQVGDVFMDDDVVDDEKTFHHQATIVFTCQLHT